MANFIPSQVGLSYPKRKETLTLVFPILRTDNATPKCALPATAVVCNIHVMQTSAATGGAATFNVGYAGTATALINGYSMATSSTGLQNVGATAGAAVMTKLPADRLITSTYVPGSSTAGGEGFVILDFYLAESNGAVDD